MSLATSCEHTNRQIPIIHLQQYPIASGKSESLESGADRSLEHPNDLLELVKAVARNCDTRVGSDCRRLIKLAQDAETSRTCQSVPFGFNALPF